MKTILEVLQSVKSDENFAASDDFISDGLLDSLDIQMVAAALEETYGIRLGGSDSAPMHFTSIEAIRELLASHGIEGV